MTPPHSPSGPAQPNRALDRPLAVVVIGAGAIGTAVAESLENGDVPGAKLIAVLRSSSTHGEIAA
ncbi:hypothetical protein G6027_14600, partial [Dietzia sp. SLG310A2-38A2]|nr:hypothetical protein [Dietzia sp. SLG310A2-38A2]